MLGTGLSTKINKIIFPVFKLPHSSRPTFKEADVLWAETEATGRRNSLLWGSGSKQAEKGGLRKGNRERQAVGGGVLVMAVGSYQMMPGGQSGSGRF